MQLLCIILRETKPLGEWKDFFEYYIEQKDVQLCELGKRLERLGQKSCDNGKGLTMIKTKEKMEEKLGKKCICLRLCAELFKVGEEAGRRRGKKENYFSGRRFN